jgi:hypothetical protein
MKQRFTEALRDDVERCDGVGFQEVDGWDWREGCETCLRRIAPRGERVWMIEPTKIIAFECEFLIEPVNTKKNNMITKLESETLS